MSNIYRDILNGTRELFSSVIDNSLNNVMKVLTSVTIILSIPTITSGLWGMNTSSLPLVDSPYGFEIICGLTALLCAIVVLILRKKDLF